MIISHKHKFIFIKSKKTAGTSVEIYLSGICGDEDIVTPIYPHVNGHEPRNYKGLFSLKQYLKQGGLKLFIKALVDLVRLRKFYNHISAEEIKLRVHPRIWNEYTKFSIERQPESKIISQYNMHLSRGQVKSLEEFFQKKRFPINERFFCINKKFILNSLISYENLQDDLKAFLLKKQIIQPQDKLVLPKAKKEYSKDKPTIVLNDNQREIIQQIPGIYFEPKKWNDL